MKEKVISLVAHMILFAFWLIFWAPLTLMYKTRVYLEERGKSGTM